MPMSRCKALPSLTTAPLPSVTRAISVIWTINPITKLVTQLTGQLGTNGDAVGVTNFASLDQPHQLVRVGGNQIVAADYGNNRLGAHPAQWHGRH